MLLLIATSLLVVAVVLWRLPRRSRWQWKLLARSIAGLLICASVLVVAADLLGSMMCGRYEFPVIPSKDGMLVAQVSEEDCGAVDSFHSSVHLWQNRRGLWVWLLGRRTHSKEVFSVGHDPRLIDVSWKDERTLLIRYPGDSHSPEEFQCDKHWKNIQIECVSYIPDYSKPVGAMPVPEHSLW